MTDISPAAPTLVFVEHVLWTPGNEWRLALEHLADRFRRVAPLDVDAVLARGPLHLQLDELASWAEGPKADIDRELGRFLDEHLSMHVRPDATVTRAVRARAALGPVHAVSALPARPAESIARHGGAWRSITQLHANVRDADALRDVVLSTGAELLVAAGDTPLPLDMPVAVRIATDIAALAAT
jgi:hypothetical protein